MEDSFFSRSFLVLTFWYFWLRRTTALGLGQAKSTDIHIYLPSFVLKQKKQKFKVLVAMPEKYSQRLKVLKLAPPRYPTPAQTVKLF
ncbi:hypothetical protein PG623_00655 [Riemerella anatipestifer]|nr:hypothetical protein [Riemerella anatipestifer]MDY3362501.1 hypothetical protein [Riemerella anatipestifer]MDY3521145.1 hypothetical protein [Riemerella anatipestifer]MDY3533734.1 hypothetical protein [Riemerella anatipestifer]MDY3535649.1 hypothetical protein [Riemerella anatipestifer]